jgi:uncharacterized protein (DUF1778 family)
MKTATASPSKPAPREMLNLRIAARDHNLIDRAAKSSGKTRTEFILGAARRAAEETLLDQSLFLVSQSNCAKILAMLDAPAKPSARLKRTMKATPAWSKP